MRYVAQCKWSKEDSLEVYLRTHGVTFKCSEGDEWSTVVLGIEQVQGLQSALTKWLQQSGEVSY